VLPSGGDLLNIFYDEPKGDRWLPWDRYPRALMRRIVRGKPRPGGHRRVFLNLCEGLNALQIPYRVNDYAFARRNPNALACIVGKPTVLEKMEWRNPILLGSSIYSHPIDHPDFLTRFPIKKVLLPGGWLKDMFSLSWGEIVESWPVGIHTDLWAPSAASHKTIDVLLYDKIFWHRQEREPNFLEPIRQTLRSQNRSFVELKYGFYKEEDFRKLLAASRAMVFISEHESQGIAYQQALSCGVPIFAWDSGGPWNDPAYYPHRVVYGPVTSVPYWDERCGMKFASEEGFRLGWSSFWDGVISKRFRPRDYILENLTLERCTKQYVQFARALI